MNKAARLNCVGKKCLIILCKSLGYTLVLSSLVSQGYTGRDVQKLCNMIDYKLYILNYNMMLK
jgi:hypothetical protein